MICPPAPFRLPVALGLALLLAGPGEAASAAGLMPHEAEYRISISTLEQAPTIGKARQKLTSCNGTWTLERDVEASFALTQTLRFDVGSVLRAREAVDGRSLTYSLNRAINGERSRREGSIALTSRGGTATLNSPEGRLRIELPPETVLPVGLVLAAIERLKRGATEFSLETFDAELTSDNFLVRGSVLDPQDLPPRYLDGIERERIGARVWPLQLQFFRAAQPTDPPLFQTRLRLHETGVISRMVLTYGWVSLGIDMTAFSALPEAGC